jgi:hypothetical protein
MNANLEQILMGIVPTVSQENDSKKPDFSFSSLATGTRGSRPACWRGGRKPRRGARLLRRRKPKLGGGAEHPRNLSAPTGALIFYQCLKVINIRRRVEIR